MDSDDLLIVAAVLCVAGGFTLMFGVGAGMISLGLLLMVVVVVANLVRKHQK